MPASPLLTVMMDAVRKAARDVKRDYGEVSDLQVSQKGPGDFVTKSDKRAEKVLRDDLMKARPGYGFLMEEEGEIKGTDPENRWIIDPIDGTLNFIHAVPLFAISVALERKGELFAGVTYNPITDEMFVAEKGGGAFLNNRRMRVASRRDIHDCMVSCSIPHRGRKDQALARAEIGVMQGKAVGIRRLGSSCLELAYVAAGRFDATWQRNVMPWDMAAGIVLIREAGGFVSDVAGDANPMDTGNIAAGNADILPQLKAALTEARQPA